MLPLTTQAPPPPGPPLSLPKPGGDSLAVKLSGPEAPVPGHLPPKVLPPTAGAKDSDLRDGCHSCSVLGLLPPPPGWNEIQEEAGARILP